MFRTRTFTKTAASNKNRNALLHHDDKERKLVPEPYTTQAPVIKVRLCKSKKGNENKEGIASEPAGKAYNGKTFKRDLKRIFLACQEHFENGGDLLPHIIVPI